MTDEDYIADLTAVWVKRRVPRSLMVFVLRLLRTDERMRDISYVCQMTNDRDEKLSPDMQSVQDLRALREAGIESPMSFPYFRLYTERDLIHCKILVPNLKAWDFKTGKKVIT